MTARIPVPAPTVAIVVVVPEDATFAEAARGHGVALGVSEPAAATTASFIVVPAVVVARPRIGSAAAIIIVIADETAAFVSFRTLISGHAMLLGWAIFALKLMK